MVRALRRPAPAARAGRRTGRSSTGSRAEPGPVPGRQQQCAADLLRAGGEQVRAAGRAGGLLGMRGECAPAAAVPASRRTRTVGPGPASVRLTRTVVPPDRVPPCTPPAGLSSVRPVRSRGPQRRSRPGRPRRGEQARCPRRRRVPRGPGGWRGVTGGGGAGRSARPRGPSQQAAWRRSASAVHTIRPSPVRAGHPGHDVEPALGSASSRISVVSPVAGSAASSRIRRWSRLCTTISGSAVLPVHRDQVRKRSPVPARPRPGCRPAGRAAATRRRSACPRPGSRSSAAGRSGLAGSAMCQRCTGVSSTRAVRMAEPSGAHQ